MKIRPCAVMALIICISSLVFFFSSTSATAGMPLDAITGFVLDEYGQPVPNAIVTLWQDGRMWQPNESVFPGIANPQATGFEGDKKGSFLFGLLYPGQYIVTVEKYGYNGSASVQVNNTKVHSPYITDIILEGFDAALSQEQVSYHGAIVGEIWSRHHEKLVHYAYVSVWQNGQMVKITGNPQKSMDGNYSFKHLAPGYYVVKVEAQLPTGDIITENATVDVGTGIVNKEIVMQYYPNFGPIWTPTLPPPSPVPTPSPLPSSPAPAQTSPDATPAPSTGIIMVLLSIGFTGALICKSRIKR